MKLLALLAAVLLLGSLAYTKCREYGDKINLAQAVQMRQQSCADAASRPQDLALAAICVADSHRVAELTK